MHIKEDKLAKELNQAQINSIVENINLHMNQIKIYAGIIEESVKKLDRRKTQSINTFQSNLKVLVDHHEESKKQWEILKKNVLTIG